MFCTQYLLHKRFVTHQKVGYLVQLIAFSVQFSVYELLSSHALETRLQMAAFEAAFCTWPRTSVNSAWAKPYIYHAPSRNSKKKMIISEMRRNNQAYFEQPDLRSKALAKILKG